VLDVGCGCGTSTLELARAVGPAGRVAALDISGPMLAEGEARAKAAGIANVDWQQADAATGALDGFNLLVSDFGVMFFGDPVAAFAHMRSAPGARMAFVCWRPVAENSWLKVPMDAVSRHLPPRPKPDPQASRRGEGQQRLRHRRQGDVGVLLPRHPGVARGPFQKGRLIGVRLLRAGHPSLLCGSHGRCTIRERAAGGAAAILPQPTFPA